MECDRCHAAIEPGDEKQHLGQTLCMRRDLLL
jgi:hypothetical protein